MITVEAAVDDFLIALEVDGRRPATIKWYKSLLGVFTTRFFGSTLDAITPSKIRQYIWELQRRNHRYINTPQRREVSGGVSAETVRAHVRALDGFWTWCKTEYQLTVNPMSTIRHPKRLIPHPKAIDPQDVAGLMSATGDDVAGTRDRAILAFLWDTGCRAQTIMKLDMAHLDLHARRAIVEEKGRPERSVPFTQQTGELLTAWLEARPIEAKTVFCSLARHTYGRLMTSNSLHEMLRRLKKKADVTGPVNTHAFRHGNARGYIKNGGSLATLSRQLGHSDVNVTVEYYAVFSEDELADMHDKFSPMQNLKFATTSSSNEPESGEFEAF